jgi:hypothetical protein
LPRPRRQVLDRPSRKSGRGNFSLNHRAHLIDLAILSCLIGGLDSLCTYPARRHRQLFRDGESREYVSFKQRLTTIDSLVQLTVPTPLLHVLIPADDGQNADSPSDESAQGIRRPKGKGQEGLSQAIGSGVMIRRFSRATMILQESMLGMLSGRNKNG